MILQKTLFMTVFAWLLAGVSFAAIESDIDLKSVLDSRLVVGSVAFPANHHQLSKEQLKNIDRLMSQALEKRGEHGIIRIEGFADGGDVQHGENSAAFQRARSVWNYLSKRYHPDDLYLTAFSAGQTISPQKGARVEIVLYANPFVTR